MWITFVFFIKTHYKKLYDMIQLSHKKEETKQYGIMNLVHIKLQKKEIPQASFDRHADQEISLIAI